MKISRYYPRVSIAALILTVIAACLALAVYAQSTNTIQGCYSNGNGSLRRVNSPGDCNNSETPISWNITGPQGIQGPVGPTGPTGPQGPPGEPIGITGRWEGNLTGTVENCSYFGTNQLRVIFIQLPTGDTTGAIRVGTGTASSVFGAITGPNITFDTGGSGVLLNGTLQDANSMSGTFSDCCFDGPPCGTWSIQRIPPNP